jgi:hypothetical protein
MPMQPTPSRTLKPTGQALLGLGFLILSGHLLDKAAIRSGQLFCSLAANLLNQLPSLLLTGCRGFEASALGRQGLLVCFRILAFTGPLLHSILERIKL